MHPPDTSRWALLVLLCAAHTLIATLITTSFNHLPLSLSFHLTVRFSKSEVPHSRLYATYMPGTQWMLKNRAMTSKRIRSSFSEILPVHSDFNDLSRAQGRSTTLNVRVSFAGDPRTLFPSFWGRSSPHFLWKPFFPSSLPHTLRQSDTRLQLQNWVQSGRSEAEHPFPLEMG